MSSGKYETQILDAIQILVDNAISKAKFDKTIKAVISNELDPAKGEYAISYQGESMIAYSTNIEAKYLKGSEVYVLIPENDMRLRKTILGTVDSLGVDYISIVEGDAAYDYVGNNTIATDSVFELCSYNGTEIKVLYNRDTQTDLINFDAKGFETYIKQSGYLVGGAYFQTSLPLEQQLQGDFGIAFDLDFVNGQGETVTKTYLINTEQMTGFPYNFNTATRQYGIFEIDNNNFLSVKQIYIFSKDFPETAEDQYNDIFISKIELRAANALTPEELTETRLVLETPQGIYFDKISSDYEVKNIQAQIKIKGRTLSSVDNVKYYWFRENVHSTSLNTTMYNRLGGAGWECLNEYNQYYDTNNNVEWVPGKAEFKISKTMSAAYETKYKCVAVYGEIILQKSFSIYNYDSEYDISIESDQGTIFYSDNGKPSLTCKINNQEILSEDYRYIWGAIDNNNKFISLVETTDANNEYNNTLILRNTLLEKINNEEVLSASVQSQLETYNEILEKYDNQMRVEANKIHNIQLNNITNFMIFKCSVFKEDTFIGTSTINIVNDLNANNVYNLVINNGNQIFKYNEYGVAPNNGSLENPIEILPLSFTLFDPQGKEISSSSAGIKDIIWTVPLQRTLLEMPDEYSASEVTDDYLIYKGKANLNFNIYKDYIATHTNNDIQLTIDYNGAILTVKTNFTFLKTGEIGTNGTDCICKIVPNAVESDITPKYPIVTYNEDLQEYSINYRTDVEGQWFKAQLWKNGALIFNGSEAGYSEEGSRVDLQWTVLKNNYGDGVQDSSNFEINSDTGVITFNKEEIEHPANIIKATIKYNGVEYISTIPLTLVRVINSNFDVNLIEESGFRNVMYTADGKYPSYNSSLPFEIQVYQMIDGNKEDVSILEKDFSVDYEWITKGQVYYSYWQSESNLIEKTLYRSKENRNQRYFEPIDIYNGLCVTNAVECIISRDETKLASIHIPVHMYLNRYGNSAINGWDGNSVSIDENGSGLILAPQIGAGTKNADNSFTGIFMGSVKETGAEKEQHGLFGYNAGQRTIELNAEDGSARFGASGRGQIVIDPSTGRALIESGNFNTEAGTGMRIDLSEPSIEFGSGNFKVDKYGRMYAKGFSTIEYVDEKKDEIIKEVEDIIEGISDFDVVLSTSNIFVPCDENNIPVYEATYNVDFTGVFKEEELEIGSVDVLYKNTGFPQTINNITISLTDNEQRLHFSVKNTGTADDIQIPTNTNLAFDFIYLDEIEDVTYTKQKTISITVLPPGAPGKSAYDIWLEQGNTGTEEDYLASLKGQSAQLSDFETERTIGGYGTQLLSNSGNHEIPILSVYGNVEQDTQYTKNILRGFQEPISNTYYWSFGSSLQVENLEDGWGRITLDNSTGTSTLTNGIQMGLNNLINWKYKTKYTVIVEIRNSSISGSSAFYPIGDGGGGVHCFDDESWRLSNAQINNGGVYSWKGTTLNSGYPWEYLRATLSAVAGTISTIEIRYSMYEGDFELGDTFEYIPCQCLYPTIDNPKTIKTASYTNMFNTEKWYQECSSIASTSISKVTIDNIETYKVRASELVDFNFMENEFEENIQYHLSFEGRQISLSGTTMRVEFRYTDGTVSSVNVPTSKTTFSTASISSTAGKTIQGIGVNSDEDDLSTFVYIRKILLTRGSGKKDYLPYNQNVLSIITNVKNLINIYELTPNKRINGKTGEEMSFSGCVVSPFIKLENIASLSKSYLLHNFAYYDQNFKYLGYGEQLLKDTIYIPSSEKTADNIIPYHLNPNITYIRVSYVGNGVTSATTWLKEALAANSFNHSSLVIRAQTTSTGITTGSDASGAKATKHSIQLDQPFARVANPIERKPSIARDTVTIEDEIAQISYATKFIKWDGLEDNWEVYYETDDYIAFAMADSEISTDTTYRRMRSSHFEPGYKIWNPEVKDQPIEALWTLTGYIGIQILKSRLTENTIEGWKSWLAQNPITIIADRKTNITSIDPELYFLETKKPITYLHTDYNDAKPELSGIYYTGVKGEAGESVICKITPSAQMFKSADGPTGQFSPQEIYLFPEIFNTHFKEWLYSIDSMTWYPVVSGEHGLEIGTFSEKENTLKISNDSDLYTEEDLTVSFKCTTYMDQIYDVATIAKSYEVVDLTVGGRNFILKSHMFEPSEIGAAPLGTEWVVEQPQSGIVSTEVVEIEGEQWWKIKSNGGDGILNWRHSETATTYLQDQDGYVFSYDIYAEDGSTMQAPLFKCFSDDEYKTMDNIISTETSRVCTTGSWDSEAAHNQDANIGMFYFDFTGLAGTYYITKLKLEKGKNPTDWTLAPEDTEMTAEVEYCIGESSQEPPLENDPLWGSATQYEADLSKGRFLWSRVKNTSTSGIVVYSKYSCLITFQKELYSQTTEYLLTDITDASEVKRTLESSTDWTIVKPTAPIIYNGVVTASKLWSRTHLVYKTIIDGTIHYDDDYANYTLDTAWEKMLSVEGELNSKISQIFANTMEGYVRIEGGTIAIADDPEEPSHLILINHYGIAFMNKEDSPGWPTPEDIEIFTEKNSAWTIDGSLDMNFINVDEIEATYIKNENLILGNHDNRLVDGLNTVDAGDLDIYDKNGHLMFETITEHLDGYPDNAVWIKGFRIHTYNVQKDGDSYENSAWSPDGYIELSCENGFGEYDISNNLIYGNKDNKWFARVSQTNKQIISSVDSSNVEYGIQIIPMTLTTDDGIKHKGIAFLRMDS